MSATGSMPVLSASSAFIVATAIRVRASASLPQPARNHHHNALSPRNPRPEQ